jgi:hypothetical protein
VGFFVVGLISKIRFYKVPGTTDAWLKYCCTIGKPGDKRKNKQTEISGENRLLSSSVSICKKEDEK